ncbi:DUF1841 family protein [Candidatus Thioglobus sp.]|uniref:DUF1841 family protein n=1 Tax=Candidatus Thioglobus sp. TaxID=2026721 RepID=UPI00260D1038|nr:DUF1841 family protein [Candidatus Thioglobus sp.]MDG2395590.1 DUF1841 family protein [Candidatus Thioglobus sp.]
MLYTQNRTEQRKFLAKAWQKFLDKKILDPLEDQLTRVIEIHPEYHTLIQNIESDYFPEQGEVNPFLHINLHLSLREQLSINQPHGIKEIYQKILNKCSDVHEAEHQMMDCIAEMIFSAQKNNAAMDHQAYIRCLEQKSN